MISFRIGDNLLVVKPVEGVPDVTHRLIINSELYHCNFGVEAMTRPVFDMSAEYERVKGICDLQSKTLGLRDAEIEQLKIDVEHWQCENDNGVSLINCLSAEIEQLTAENGRLREVVNDQSAAIVAAIERIERLQAELAEHRQQSATITRQ